MLATIMLAVLFLNIPPAHAQVTAGIPVRVIVSPVRGAAEDSLEAIIRGAIELALNKRNFIVVDAANAGPGRPSFEFDIAVVYFLDVDHVTLTFSVSDTRGRMTTESRTLEQELDPQLDLTIGDFVHTLMAGAERELALRPRVPMVSVPVPPAEPASSVQPASSPPAEPATVTGSSAVAGTSRPPNGIEVGLGGFLPQGRAADYFKAGAQGQASYDTPVDPSGLWRACLVASFISFSVEGLDAVRADNMFAMLGGGLTLRLASLGIFSPCMAASAGPAIAMLHGAGSTSFTEFMPFGSAGLGTGIRLFERFGLNLELASIMFLDLGAGAPVIVWGFVPRLGATMEL
ncbi:MAG: hypothetical protein CVV51_08245 [Spirochaetae bacterium HGW-Spirochaetae-7]|nr:MAG: hypothetical protein CVV51_08245 [Spirochaetae bacterium HGW-Spirochaetae-7]